MGASVSYGHERVEIRTARKKHTCWGFSERMRAPGEGWDGNPPCSGIIREGERYVVSTIFPGHDSGYADGGWDASGAPVPPSPLSTSHCWACAQRWRNLRERLDRIEANQ